MKWNPEDYDGVDSLRLPIDAIWKPDIVAFNAWVDSYKCMLHSFVL